MAIAMARLRGSRRIWIVSLRAMAQTRKGFIFVIAGGLLLRPV